MLNPFLLSRILHHSSLKKNIIPEKSCQFAVDIVELFKTLQNDQKEFVLSKQLLRSGTSIRANVEEAIGGQTKKDFYAKLSISYKEARESKYWIRLLRDTNYLDSTEAEKYLLKLKS